MARAASGNGWVLGLEASAGVAATLAKRLPAYSLEVTPEVETSRYRPNGYYAATSSQLINETTVAPLEGQLDFNNLLYLLTMAFGAVAPTTIVAGAYKWEWPLNGKTPIVPKTATIEHGDTARSGKFTYAHADSLKIEASRMAEGKVSADILGQRLTPAATALTTAGITEVEVLPIAGTMWDVYAEANGAALAAPTNKIADIYKAEFDFSDFRAKDIPMDSTVLGFKSTVMGEEPKWAFSALLGASAETDSYLTTKARLNQRSFFSAKATGGQIGATANNYELKIDFAAWVDTFDSYGSEDGILCLPTDFELAYDPTWGKMANISLTNGLQTL